MLTLSNCLAHWGTDSFKQALKTELENLPPGSLPLNQATTQGGYVDDNNITATILEVSDTGDSITAKAGIFFTEIMICCGCGDDPMPQNAYGELEVVIDKQTANTELKLL